MKDAYTLLNEALELWKQNAMAHNDATSINKDTTGITLHIKAPEYGVWQATDVSFDPHFGIMIEAKVKPYTSND
jgi:hypothetical protein